MSSGERSNSGGKWSSLLDTAFAIIATAASDILIISTSLCHFPFTEMDLALEDILRLIFEAYVHELGCSPVALLTVCRRWYTILLSTRTIWSRVPIYITSLQTIPFIIGDNNSISSGHSGSPLNAYLSRSYRQGDPVAGPLDIYIKWCEPQREADAIVLEGHCTSAVSHDTRLETQICKLLQHLAGEESLTDINSLPNNPITNDREKDRFRRWRSLEFDMNEIGCNCSPMAITNFDLLLPKGCTELPLLESLITGKMDLFLDGLRMPRIRTLEMEDCVVIAFPGLSSLDSLTMIDSKLEENDESAIPNLHECINLRQIQLWNSQFWSVPLDNLFPNLKIIIFLASIPLSTMCDLEERFTPERPLEVLALAENSFYELFRRFRSAPNLHIQTLKLSAREFWGHYAHDSWGWDEFGHVRWSYNDNEMNMVQEFITLMRERGIRLEAMDTQMQAMLDFAQEEASILDV